MLNFIFGFTVCYSVFATIAVTKIFNESESRKIDAESSESDAAYFRNQCVQQMQKLEKQGRIIRRYKEQHDQQG